MHRHTRQLVIVEAGAPELFVFHREAERLDEVQPRAGVGGEADDVARVGRDLGVDENDVKHRAASSPRPS